MSGMRMLGGTVPFAVPVEVAFDYLVDPHHRPQWQSSLRAVTGVDGDPRPGQRWVDVTVPGLRPRMTTTRFERPRLWAESGTWHAVEARLELVFTPSDHRAVETSDGGCDVLVRFRITGPGPMAALGLALSVAAVPAVLADVRRASRILVAGG